jgi:hypothetical protein
VSHQPHIRRDWKNLAIRMQIVRGVVWPLVFYKPGNGFEPAIEMLDGTLYFEALPYSMSLRMAGAWAKGRAAQAARITYPDDSPLLNMLEKRAPR